MVAWVSRVGPSSRTAFFVFAAGEREAVPQRVTAGNVSLDGLDDRMEKSPPVRRGKMWRALLVLGGAFAAFLVAFLSVGWGRLVRNPERRNPWVFFDPGGGGS